MNKKLKNSSFMQTVPKYFLLISIFIVSVIFQALQHRFLSLTNIMDILRTASVVGVLAIGQTFIQATGEINFACGTQLTVGAGVIAAIMAKASAGVYPVSIVLAIAVVIISSLIAAAFVIELGVPAFMATLGMSTFLTGIAKLLMNNSSIFSNNWGPYYTFLGQGMIAKVIPIPLVIFAVIAVVSHIFFEKTRTGRYIFSVGANATASRQVGVHVKKVKYLAFVLGGACAAVAGLLLTSVTFGGTITMGTEMMLPAISAPILGATFLVPGKYNIPGTAVAVILLTVIQNGVVSAGGSFFVKDIIQGVILIISVAIIAVIREEGLPKVRFEA